MNNIIQKLWPFRRKALTGTNLDIRANEADLRSAIRFLGGQLVPYNIADRSIYIDKGYAYNDIIYSVVKMILDKAIIPPWMPYRVVDQKSYNKSRAILKNMAAGILSEGAYKEACFLQEKGLEIYESDDGLNRLLKYPNENETWSELNFGLWCYKLLIGDYFEGGWGEQISAGLSAGAPTQLYGLPSQYMRIKTASATLPLTPETYELYYGYVIPFTREDILHEKYFNPTWDSYGIQLYGQSPLKAYLKRLQRNNLAQIRGAKAMENGGADTIVYLDDDKIRSDFDLSLDQMNALKKTWNNEQAGVNNAGKAVWSSYKIGSTRLTLSPVELALLDSEKFDLEMACHVYGVPPALFSTDASTYNNLQVSERALTTRCALPLLLARESSFNRKLHTLPKYRAGNIVIAPDLTVYSELQAQKKDQVEWLEKSYLPLRRRYEIMDEEIPDFLSDDELNAIPVPSGTTLLSELFLQPQDINADVNNLNATGDNPYGNNA